MKAIRELKSDIFAAFQEWCKKNNVCHYNHLSAKGFWAIFDSTILEFKNFNYKKLKSNGKYYICNVKAKVRVGSTRVFSWKVRM